MSKNVSVFGAQTLLPGQQQRHPACTKYFQNSQVSKKLPKKINVKHKQQLFINLRLNYNSLLHYAMAGYYYTELLLQCEQFHLFLHISS